MKKTQRRFFIGIVFMVFLVCLLLSSFTACQPGHAGPQGERGIQGSAGPAGPKGDPFMVISEPSTALNEHFVDGTWRVGIDIKPGLYWTQSTSGYWARLKGFSGSMNDIIVNGNLSGPTYIQILPTDIGFESSGCGTWVRVSD